MWRRLCGTEKADLLVVGGGITGAGIARDAAHRGLSVVCVEQNDLAFGTSSRSSKLVHGGLRYLEQYEFSLVFEAVSERRILMDIAPHLVNPLGFLFPVYEGSRTKLWYINAGMWLYDGLSLFRPPKIHKKLSRKQLQEVEPALNGEGLEGAPLYYDCATDDARLTLETAIDAAHAGAVIATRARLSRFLTDDSGRLRGALIEDMLGGKHHELQAHAVVNATGPWADRTIAMSAGMEGEPLLRPTKGVHIVVDRSKLPLSHAVVCLHPDDGRVLFALPWGDRSYLGTTDTDFEGDPAEVWAEGDDVHYLLEAAAHYFPGHRLAPDDVISTWAGLRPLMRPLQKGANVDESAVSREHQIVVGRDGLITIAGGKLTTYRRMAAEVVDTAVKLLHLSGALPGKLEAAQTDQRPLPGGVGWPADDDHEAVAAQIAEAADGALSAESARSLADNYGMRGLEIAAQCRDHRELAAPLVEGRPEGVAQVDWAVEHELACTINDFMVRRTQLYYRDHDQGLGAAELAASRMAPLLGWDDEQREAEIQAYRDEVASSRAWRGE
jgi:glycerol-3-phosphate dehydrogenase